MADFVLDTSLLLGGREPPPRESWWTTPEAAAEVSPGGRDARRFDGWLAAGLRVRAAAPEDVERVEEAARAAGNRARLSPADVSLAALALGLGATLVTDDHTLLDVALRLGVRTQTVNSPGIRGTLDFRPRCSGCGRWFALAPKGDECPVCGSPVRPKPWRPERSD
jgi:endoribonuclease Nob1